MVTGRNRRPGSWVPASFLLAVWLTPAPVLAQPAAAPQRAPASLPAPDNLTALKLLWSSMAAVDQANRTGNYSVLRDLGSASFQASNNAATLAEAFAPLRAAQADLADTFLISPLWEIAPTMIDARTLRMRGRFPLRPAPVQFDLIFAWEQGWRLHAVAIQSVPERR